MFFAQAELELGFAHVIFQPVEHYRNSSSCYSDIFLRLMSQVYVPRHTICRGPADDGGIECHRHLEVQSWVELFNLLLQFFGLCIVSMFARSGSVCQNCGVLQSKHLEICNSGSNGLCFVGQL